MYLRSLLFLICIPAWAQFSEFAVTDDGLQVYFSSPLTLASDTRTGLNTESRIYRWTPVGVELVAERGPLAPTGPALSSGSGDGAGAAQVSGDGQLFGYTLHNVCPAPGVNGGPCTAVSDQTELRGTLSAALGAGTLELSRNGRWALVVSPLAPPPATQSAYLIDLQAATIASVPVPPVQSMALASDGSLLTAQGVWRAGTVTPFGIAGAIRPLALSDNGGVLVYDSILTDGAGRANGLVLMTRDLSSGRNAVVFTPPLNKPQLPRFMGVSGDGRWVLYRVTDSRIEGAAFLADTQAGTSVAIPLVDGELVSDGALNGPGDLAVIATTYHRVVKIGFVNGAINSSQVIVPTTPYTTLPALTPGSLARLSAPVPPGVQGRILLDGQPVPVLAATQDQYVIQVPWEQRTGMIPFVLDYPAQSPFQQNQSATVLALNPAFVMADPGTYPVLGIKMIKADFSGLVTAQPSPGDIVNTYMTGLGRVQGAVQTGVPAPVDSLRPIVGSFRCIFSPRTTPAETLFAGLAPGMVGLYQVTFRFPNEPITGPLNGARCMLDSPDGSAGFGFTYSSAPTQP